MTKSIEYPVFLPNKGIVLDKPQEFIKEQYSPHSRNMEFSNELLQGRGGLSKMLSTALSGIVLTKATLSLFSGTRHEVFCTPKDIYKVDFSNSRFDILTPLYQTGVVKVANGSAVVRGGLSVDNCDANPVEWADGSGGDVTPSRNTTSPQDGTAFVRLTVGAGAGVELLAYHDISSVNLTAYDSIGLWIRSSVATNSGDFQFVVDNTSACASPLETINIPALTANTWTWVNLAFVTPANLTAVVSIGIKQAVDKGACTIDIDQIVVGDWSDQVSVGDFFKVGSGSVHTGATWYEVLTVDSDTQITLTAVYAGSSADQQAYVIRQCFAGGSTDIWSWAQFLDDNLGEVLVFTNGVDTPIYWTGSNQVVAFPTLPTGFTRAKYVSVYKDRLIFLWTVEGGANQPQRERWSGVADLTSWDDLEFTDFVDESTEIRGTANFSGYHIVFKEKEAYVGRFIGGDDVFDYEKSSQCYGTPAAFSIVTRNEFIAYFGSDLKFHRWNLLQDDIVSEGIFPETKEFDPNTLELVRGFDVSRRNQVRWFCPYGDTDTHNYVVVWDYQQNIIQVWEYAETDACSCFGSYRNTTDVYADDPVYGNQYADETAGFADDSQQLTNADIVIYGGYDGYIRIADSGVVDDGSTYTRLLRLKRLNFDMPTHIKRLWRQTWWLEPQTSGSVTVKLRLDNKSSYEATTNSISLIADDDDQEIIRMPITWDKQAKDFQPEISATNHFAVLGVINYLFKKRST